MKKAGDEGSERRRLLAGVLAGRGLEVADVRFARFNRPDAARSGLLCERAPVG
ncbi:hypothetical protein [Halegenticoccus tardaugens]|uniref:hypothetical protein n=1 Tax=Halegenticoccus tardaugens TaxID=2071624 RepID=UPI0013E91367|nr:hypothetical protein [Halegenticoccus tardaugens]